MPEMELGAAPMRRGLAVSGCVAALVLVALACSSSNDSTDLAEARSSSSSPAGGSGGRMQALAGTKSGKPGTLGDYVAHSNIFIVHHLGEAQGMLRDNVVAAVPCSFGVKCHLHLKPTLIEKTGGSWLTQPEYGGTGSATVTMPRPESRSTSAAPGSVTGPWGKKPLAAQTTAKRAHSMGGDPILDAAIPMSSGGDSVEEERIAKLNAAEARIKARMDKTANSYE